MNYFVVYIIFIKVIYVSLSIYLFYLKSRKNASENAKEIESVSYWKQRFELIFIVNTSILLIYLFYPWREKPLFIGQEARVLLFTYGILILFTAKWSDFFDEIKEKRIKVRESDSKYMEINKKFESIRNYPNMQNFLTSNVEYQKYYTSVYPHDNGAPLVTCVRSVRENKSAI